MRQMTGNREYLAALLHGRRSRMAEGRRLDALCRLRSLTEFAEEVLGENEAISAVEIQRRLIQSLANEAVEVTMHLSRSAAALVLWLAARFQVENLKILLRGLLTREQAEGIRKHLVELPSGLPLNWEGLATAESLNQFVERMPSGRLRRNLRDAIDRYHDQPRAFFFEAALDRGYFAELLLRSNDFKRTEGELARPMILQEVDIFHLMLVTRGRFIYGLEPAALLPLRLPGTHIPQDLFESVMEQTDLRAVALQLAGKAIDLTGGDQAELGDHSLPMDPADLERMAWNRFWRLANRAFRRSHMGLATAAAYLELRRVEVANLITICEGIRGEVNPEALRARLVPLWNQEAIHA